MNIVIDARTTQDEIKYNGVGRYSRFIIEYMIKNYPGTSFYLVMYNSFSTLDEFLSSKPDNVQIIRTGKYYSGKGKDLIIHNLDLFFHYTLNKALKKFNSKDTIFFSPSFWRGLPVFKLPTVVTIHDFALPKFNIYSTISPFHNFLRAVHYWYEAIRVYLCKAVICDSNYTYNDFFKYFPFYKKENVYEILLGVHEEVGDVDFERYLPKDWKKRQYIAYLGGGLTANKNSNGVVAGYANFVNRLKREGKKEDEIPYLVIAGKNFKEDVVPDAIKFHKYVDDLGMHNFIHYTGFYDDLARWPITRNAFAVIHLSLFEGFGFSVAEAMSTGTPVIAHRGSTYPQVVNDGGLLVDGLNPQEVGSAIYKLFADKDFAKEVGKKGHEISKNYDWNITSKETYKVLERYVR